MGKISRNIRAARRAGLLVAGIPAILGLAAVQGFIIEPVFGNKTAIPNLLYKIARKLMGIKVVFNAASAPLVQDKPTWFVTNHTYGNDYIPIGGLLNGAFIGKSDMLKVPVIGQVARSMKFIGIRRSRKFNAQSRGAIIENFNDGNNAIMFPEGTVGDGKKINLFHAGLITALFGEEGLDEKNNKIDLKTDVVVQPVATRLLTIDGKDATNSDELKSAYRMMGQKSPLKVLWKKMQYKKVVFEITAFEPLKPSDFKDGATFTDNARNLINRAAAEVASVVNPGQTVFERAKIPGQKI